MFAMQEPSLAKIDLHRHLDGNVRLQTILELGDSFGIELPAWDVAGLRPHVVVDTPQPGLLAFLARFRWMVGVLGNLDACRRIAYENVEDAAYEKIDYLELRFSPVFMALAHGLPVAGVVEAVADGVRAGESDFGVPTRLIGTMSRTFGVESCAAELAALLSSKNALVAIDLAGDEAGFPPELFEMHFRAVREAGLPVTIHAGEAGGAPGVWTAIQRLQAVRIGHGVRAMDDPALIDYLAEHRIGVECSLTSNVQTSTVPDYGAHPIRLMLEAGVLATLNTDDPGISGIDLDHEYQVAAVAAGLSPDHIAQARRNAAAIAFDGGAVAALKLA